MLLFWGGSVLPFVVTWGAFGFAIALAGLAICLVGFVLQRRAIGYATNAESFHLLRPTPEFSLLKLNGRCWNALVFGLSIALFVAIWSFWSASRPKSLFWTYWPYLQPFGCGFALGLLPGAYAFQNAALLWVLLAIAGGAIHWGAWHLGIQVDWQSTQGSMMTALLGALFIVPLTLLGCGFGRLTLHIARHFGARKKSY